MATDREAIARYLARDLPPLRRFKGLPAAKLHGMIEEALGIPYRAIGHAPRPAQLEGLAYALSQGRALPLYGTRVGKTKLGLDYARMLRLSSRWSEGKAIVFAGPIGGVDVWEKQALTESIQTVKGVRSGPGAKDQLFKLLQDQKTDIIVLAWSTLQEIFTNVTKSKGAKKATAKIDSKLLAKAAGFIGLCIIDEIHKVANPQSVRFRIASRLIVNCEWRLGYTGTLVGRDPYKVWAPFFLIDEGKLLGPSFSFFKEAFAKPLTASQQKNRDVLPHYLLLPKFDKAKLTLLESWIASFTFSYDFREVQTVNLIADQVDLKMGPIQRKAYSDLIALADEARYSDQKQRENTFVRLRQISAGFVPFHDEEGQRQHYFFPDAAKAGWLRRFLRAYDQSYQVLIFHEFIPAGNLICGLLKAAGVPHARVGAKIRGPKAAANVEAFQKGEVRVLCAASAAASEALELGMADYLLFYDCPTSPIVRTQAEGRPLNRQGRPLHMDDLVCSPLDTKILGYIKEGINIRAKLQGSGFSFRKLFGGGA